MNLVSLTEDLAVTGVSLQDYPQAIIRDEFSQQEDVFYPGQIVFQRAILVRVTSNAIHVQDLKTGSESILSMAQGSAGRIVRRMEPVILPAPTEFGTREIKLQPVSREVTKLVFPTTMSTEGLPSAIIKLDDTKQSISDRENAFGLSDVSFALEYLPGRVGIRLGAVNPSSVFGALGFDERTIIIAVNGQKTGSTDELRKLLAKDPLPLTTIEYRQGAYLFTKQVLQREIEKPSLQ